MQRMDEVVSPHRAEQRPAEEEMWELSLIPELYPWAEAVTGAVLQDTWLGLCRTFVRFCT